MSQKQARNLTLSTLRLTQSGRVLTVKVDAGPFNYMTAQMQQDFLQLVRAVAKDESIGAVVVTGAPEQRYITHFDIADILTAAQSFPVLPRPVASVLLVGARALTHPWVIRRLATSKISGLLAIAGFHRMVQDLLRSPAVWIAAVNGPCGGGGLEMSVFFDLRLAAEENATFIVPELSIGLTTTVGAQRLTHLVGPANALDMLLQARAFSAAEAQQMGLVNRVVPAGELLAEAHAMAERAAARPRPTVAAQKRIINDAYRTRASRSLFHEGVAQIMGVPSRRTRDALQKWLQMQAPNGDSVFLTDPKPWSEGTAIDLNPAPDRDGISG